MERWQREEIMFEGGVRAPTPLERQDALRLQEDTAGLAGKPLRRRLRNFRPDPASYLASLGGPLPYMRRLREIHDLMAFHERELEKAYDRLSLECRDRHELERRLRVLAERLSFHEVNDLIDKHNRYFPIEARLPMDPKTGDFVLVGGEPYRRRPLDARWALGRLGLAA